MEIATSAAIANLQDYVMESTAELRPCTDQDTNPDVTVRDGAIDVHFRGPTGESALLIGIWPPSPGADGSDS